MKPKRQLGFLLAFLAAFLTATYLDSTLRFESTSWSGFMPLLPVFFVPPMLLLVLVLLAGLEVDSGSQTPPKGELEVLIHQKHHGVLWNRARRIHDATARRGPSYSKGQNPPNPWIKILHKPEKVLNHFVQVERQTAIALVKPYQGEGQATR